MNEARAEALRDRADDARKRDRENGIPNPLVEAWKNENRAQPGEHRCEIHIGLGSSRCILRNAHEGGHFFVSLRK